MIKTAVLALIGLALLGGIMELCLYYFVVQQGKQARPEKSDVILVLGCRINGEYPSLSLQYRLDKALELYEQGYGKVLLVSGGQGPDEIMPEARLMKEYLMSHGVEEANILVEDRSSSTYENIEFSKKIMDEKGYRSAVVVTSDFHIYRSVSMAKKAGIKATGAPAPSVDWLKTSYRIRETLAILHYWVFGK